MAEKILFVDDDTNILAGFRRQLRNDYSVETANSGQEGLDVLSAIGPFAVVVADFRMPGMDGVQFLMRAREVSPDTVRVMLTGHAELSQAIDAVNEGNIFRFLTKPCPPEMLTRALDAALEQHHLITAERELLEKTLSNSIRLLTEVLSMVSPSAFSQTLRIRKIVRAIAHNLTSHSAWQYELAAMLSQIGCVALPSSLLEKVYQGQDLTKNEMSMFASHPIIGYRLLEGIPRIGDVPQMVRDQQKDYYDYDEKPGTTDVRSSELGAQILKAAIDYDRLVQYGTPHQDVIKILSNERRKYNPKVIKALGEDPIQNDKWKFKMTMVDSLDLGMVADQDILTKDGFLVTAKSQEISPPVLERLQLLAREVGIVEPFRVRVSAVE
jgi:response regulator RpfG family c-di-GMP phosphodiesterase